MCHEQKLNSCMLSSEEYEEETINLLLNENQSIFYYLMTIFTLVFMEFNISDILDTIMFLIITYRIRSIVICKESSSVSLTLIWNELDFLGNAMKRQYGSRHERRFGVVDI